MNIYVHVHTCIYTPSIDMHIHSHTYREIACTHNFLPLPHTNAPNSSRRSLRPCSPSARPCSPSANIVSDRSAAALRNLCSSTFDVNHMDEGIESLVEGGSRYSRTSHFDAKN